MVTMLHPNTLADCFHTLTKVNISPKSIQTNHPKIVIPIDTKWGRQAYAKQQGNKIAAMIQLGAKLKAKAQNWRQRVQPEWMPKDKGNQTVPKLECLSQVTQTAARTSARWER